VYPSFSLNREAAATSPGSSRPTFWPPVCSRVGPPSWSL